MQLAVPVHKALGTAKQQIRDYAFPQPVTQKSQSSVKSRQLAVVARVYLSNDGEVFNFLKEHSRVTYFSPYLHKQVLGAHAGPLQNDLSKWLCPKDFLLW